MCVAVVPRGMRRGPLCTPQGAPLHQTSPARPLHRVLPVPTIAVSIGARWPRPYRGFFISGAPFFFFLVAFFFFLPFDFARHNSSGIFVERNLLWKLIIEIYNG